MLELPPDQQTHEEYKAFLREQESQLRIGYSTHIIDPESLPNFLKTYKLNLPDTVISYEIVDCKIVKTELAIKIRCIFTKRLSYN